MSVPVSLERFDVAIAGGGPVGCALGAALAGSGVSVLQIRDGAAAQDRPIALSYGSRQILQRLGHWTGNTGTPIATIHVSQQHGFGRTVISAGDYGLPALGYVVSYVDLLASLSTRESGPVVPGKVLTWTVDPDAVRVRVATADAAYQCSARLLVLADGADAADEVRDYEQWAVVATMRTERPHRFVAWERFAPQGPIALLPDRDFHALIWSVSTQSVASLLESPPDMFVARLQAAFGDRLGRFQLLGARSAFPLALRLSRTPPALRVLPIGNAAQTLHPVAGQGLNLGLRDAAELAEQVLATPGNELGSRDFLRRYWNRRRLDREGSIRFTDALVRVFSHPSPSLAALRGAGLLLLDAIPPARHFLARRMMFGGRALP